MFGDSVRDAIKNVFEDLLKQNSPLEYVRSLYNFGGNHDKPRLAHLMFVDLDLCHSVLSELPLEDKKREVALTMITGATSPFEYPFDVQYNLKDGDYIADNYFMKASTYAIALGYAIRSKLHTVFDLKNSEESAKLNKLFRAVTALVNGYNTMEPEKRPSYLDYNTAFAEILDMAKANGLRLQDSACQQLGQEVYNRSRELFMDGNKDKIYRYYNGTNAARQVEDLANILRRAFDEKVYELRNSGNKSFEDVEAIVGQVHSAIGSYLNKYTQAFVEEELLRHQINLATRSDDELDAFGCSDLKSAIEMVFEKAGYNKHDNKAFELFKRINDPAFERVLIYTAQQQASPGMTVINAGDEFSMSGYEEKAKNITHQNRNALPFSLLNDPNPEVAKYFKGLVDEMAAVLGVRNKAVAFNNGTPYLLKTNGAGTSLPGVLRVSADGSVAVSIFNTVGLSTEKNKEYNNGTDNPYIPVPTDCEYDYIELNVDDPNWMGVGGLTVATGMVLKNVLDSDDSIYKFCREKFDGFEKYVVKRYKPTGENLKVKVGSGTALHSVLNLYRNAKKSGIHFKGNRKELYNPKYNIVSNPYSFVNDIPSETGTKLSLLSK